MNHHFARWDLKHGETTLHWPAMPDPAFPSRPCYGKQPISFHLLVHQIRWEKPHLCLVFESILQEGSCCGAGDCHQTAKKKTWGLFFFIMHSMPQGARAGYYGREKKNRGKIHRAWRRNESCGCVREKRYCLYYACCLLLTFHLFLGFSVHSFDSFTTRRFAVFFISLDWYFESMPHSVLSSFSSSSFSTLISQLVFISAREK